MSHRQIEAKHIRAHHVLLGSKYGELVYNEGSEGIAVCEKGEIPVVVE